MHFIASPYDDPDKLQLESKPKQKDIHRDGFVPRDSKSSSSGIYETPQETAYEQIREREVAPVPVKKESIASSIYDDDLLIEMVNING